MGFSFRPATPAEVTGRLYAASSHALGGNVSQVLAREGTEISRAKLWARLVKESGAEAD